MTIKSDLDIWLINRLGTVLSDGYDRHRIGGASRVDAMTSVLHMLFVVLSNTLAAIDVEPEEAGAHLAELIAESRQHKRKKSGGKT